MFKHLSKQAFKSMGVHHYRLQVHHPRRAISTTPRYNTDDDRDSTSGANDPAHSTAGFQSSGPAPFVTWDRFSQLEKDVSIMKVGIGYLGEGQKELKSEIKDLSGKMERKFEHVDRKFDKTDGKIGRVLYGIITGLVGFVLKGGFDYYQAHKK